MEQNNMKKEIIAECGYKGNVFGFLYTVSYEYRETCDLDSDKCRSKMKRRLWMKGWNPKKNCKISIVDLE